MLLIRHEDVPNLGGGKNKTVLAASGVAMTATATRLPDSSACRMGVGGSRLVKYILWCRCSISKYFKAKSIFCADEVSHTLKYFFSAEALTFIRSYMYGPQSHLLKTLVISLSLTDTFSPVSRFQTLFCLLPLQTLLLSCPVC